VDLLEVHATDVAGSAGTPTLAARRHSPLAGHRCDAPGMGETAAQAHPRSTASFPPRTPRSPKRQLIPWNDRSFPGAIRGRSQLGSRWALLNLRAPRSSARRNPAASVVDGLVATAENRLALQRGAGSLQASAMPAWGPLVGARLRVSAHSTRWR